MHMQICEYATAATIHEQQCVCSISSIRPARYGKYTETFLYKANLAWQPTPQKTRGSVKRDNFAPVHKIRSAHAPNACYQLPPQKLAEPKVT